MKREIKITLVGAGMGSESCLTEEVKNIIKEADIVFGAGRLSSPFADSSVQKIVDTYRVEDMIDVLNNVICNGDRFRVGNPGDEHDSGLNDLPWPDENDRNTLPWPDDNDTNGLPWPDESDKNDLLSQEDAVCKCVFVYSGDSGFYSGAEKAYLRLLEWAEEKKKTDQELKINIDIKPGISSVSYLASRLRVSWQDAEIFSLHGRDFDEEIGKVIASARFSEKTFVLLSGTKDVRRLAEALLAERMSGISDSVGVVTDGIKNNEELELQLGYRLSYPDEKLIKIIFTEESTWNNPSRAENDGITVLNYSSENDVMNNIEEGLYTAFIHNPAPERKPLSYGIPTSRYLREEHVPITKEEIREIVISKLRLFEGCTFYDIGSGTGGVTIDVAGVSPTIKVIAFEKKPERIELLRKNMERFGVHNITPIAGDAADILDGDFLKNNPPDRVFIGGTEGRLRDIINLLRTYDRTIRVCITAITERTKNEILAMLGEGIFTEPDIVEVSVSRLIQQDGRYEMKAENPIMIAAFTLQED